MGNKFGKYLAVTSQMTGAIIGMAALGYFLDHYFEIEKHYLTLVFSLIGVFAGLYLLMKGVKDLNEE